MKSHGDQCAATSPTAEFSDGTLRFLLLLAALLTPRPPELMVVNEPESSLHSDLLPALAELVVRAAQRTQVLVVSHSAPLLASLRSAATTARREVTTIELTKELGQTRVSGQDLLGGPPWIWPGR